MPDPQSVPPTAPPLLELAEQWRAQLRTISAADVAPAQAQLAAALEDAPTAAPFRGVRSVLQGVKGEAELVARTAAGLLHELEVLERQWRRTRRFADEGLTELVEELRVTLDERPRRGARRWLGEVLGALEVSEPAAARRLAQTTLPFPPQLLPGVAAVRDALSEAGDGDPPLDLLEQIAAGELPGWGHWLGDELEGRARRLAAWAYGAIAGDLERARRHLDAAVKLDADRAHSHAERAALHLLLGTPGPAARDAQKVIDLAPDEPLGYQMLGACCEQKRDFEQADELYAEALDRLTPREIAAASRGTTLAQPTGRALLRAAERLLNEDHPELALPVLDEALARSVKGPAVYSDADVYRVRSLALERIEGTPQAEIAAAAYEAGQRYLWNQDGARAVSELRRAVGLGVEARGAGWLLADALLIRPGALDAYPDPERVSEARDAWESWTEAVGPPGRSTSWAYVTRAFITDELTNRADPVPERAASMWEAAGWLERALALDEEDSLRWASSAAYLRNVSLMRLALEAVERASELNPDGQMVLIERQTALANVGRLEEAAETGRKLLERYGGDGWVHAVQAWIVSRLGQQEEALELLEGPLADHYDPGWYRPLLAQCQLRAGDADGMRRTYAQIVEQPGATALSEVAIACTVLGDLGGAAHWVRRAAQDPMTSRGARQNAEALLSFVLGDARRGAELLEATLVGASFARALDDEVDAFLRKLGAAPGDLEVKRERERAAREVIHRVVPERMAHFERTRMTADRELETALAEVRAGERSDATPLSEVVLMAIGSRRLADRGLSEPAADGYTDLLGSWFDPDARVRLLGLLEQMRDDRAAKGDVAGVREIEARLAELGASDLVQRTLLLTSALAGAGQVSEAKQQVLDELDHAETPSQVERLHRAHAELELLSDNLPGAASSFLEAIEAARKHRRPGPVAQYHTRLALIEAAAGDRAAAEHRLYAALESWREAKSFEPDWALGRELQGLAWYEAFRELYDRARPVLGEALDDLATAGAIDPAALGKVQLPEAG